MKLKENKNKHLYGTATVGVLSFKLSFISSNAIYIIPILIYCIFKVSDTENLNIPPFNLLMIWGKNLNLISIKRMFMALYFILKSLNDSKTVLGCLSLYSVCCFKH